MVTQGVQERKYSHCGDQLNFYRGLNIKINIIRLKDLHRHKMRRVWDLVGSEMEG